MSPVDPRSLRPTGRADPVTPGTQCPQCDYLLDGLCGGGRCPECGTPIRTNPLPGVQARDNLADAPVPFLRRLRTTLITLAFLGLGNAILQGVFSVVPHELLPWLMMLSGTAWAVVVIPATQPRPFVQGMRHHPRTELPRVRLFARVLQWAWPLQGVLLIAMQAVASTNATAAEFLFWGARLALLLGIVGFAPLCFWFAHLADWAQHTALAIRLRGTAFLLGVCGSLFLISLWTAVSIAPHPLAGLLGLVAFLTAFAYAAGLLLFLLGQLQIANTANWAVRNAVTTIARDQRVLERKARRTFRGQAPEGSILADMTAARGEGVLDPCANCGHDLTGLPPGARCPECGREQAEVSHTFVHRPTIAPPPPLDLDDIPLVGDESE